MSRRGVLATGLGVGAIGGAVGMFGSGTAEAAPQPDVTPFVAKSVMPVNVKDHGAVGDGETDDADAIQAAIDKVGDAGGGTVFFPAGRYAVSRPVAVTSNNVVLMGEGPGSQVIHHDPDARHTLVMLRGPEGRRTGYLRRCGIRYLGVGDHVLENDAPDGPTDGDPAVVLTKAITFHLERVVIKQAGGPGLMLFDAYIGSVTGCLIRLNTDGILIQGVANALRFVDNQIQKNSGVGIRTPVDEITSNEFQSQFKGIYIAGNDIEGNGSYGILFENSYYHGVVIEANYFELNFAPLFTTERGPHIYKPATTNPGIKTFQGVSITGNQFAIRPDDISEPAPTIVIEQGSQISILGNSFLTYGSNDPDIRFRDSVVLGDDVTDAIVGPTAGRALMATGDLWVDDQHGVVLASPNGSRFRIVVDDDGNLRSEGIG